MNGVPKHRSVWLRLKLQYIYMQLLYDKPYISYNQWLVFLLFADVLIIN